MLTFALASSRLQMLALSSPTLHVRDMILSKSFLQRVYTVMRYTISAANSTFLHQTALIGQDITLHLGPSNPLIWFQMLDELWHVCIINQPISQNNPAGKGGNSGSDSGAKVGKSGISVTIIMLIIILSSLFLLMHASYPHSCLIVLPASCARYVPC